MRLIWRPRARRELFAIFEYIAHHDFGAAEGIAAEIDQSAQRLKTFPQLGKPSRDVNVRLLQVPNRPYLLPYQVKRDRVEILAVLDERMKRPPGWT